MPVISFEYLSIALASYGVSALVPGRLRILVLLAASYGAMALLDSRIPLVIMAFTTVNYLLLLGARTGARPRAALTGAVLLNLAFLVLVVEDSVARPLGEREVVIKGAIFDEHAPEIASVFALGAAFYVLQALGYLISVVGDRRRPVAGIAEYALLLGFFPKLWGGPVVDGNSFVDWARAGAPRPTAQIRRRGLWYCMAGAFTKLAIANRLASFTDPVFAEADTYKLANTLAFYMFPFQFFADMIGYLLLARGLCLMFGVPLNDEQAPRGAAPWPWRMWYPDIVTWIRQHAGALVPRSWPAPVRILALFAVLGLWHRPSLQFALLGAWVGVIYLAWTVTPGPGRATGHRGVRVLRCLVAAWRLALLHALAAALVWLRLGSFDAAWRLCRGALTHALDVPSRLSSLGSGRGIVGPLPEVIAEGEMFYPILVLALACGLHAWVGRTRFVEWVDGQPFWLRVVCFHAVFWGIAVVGRFSDSPFLYAWL
jgi:alginate O-acetyltransferase complex protein AlgI